MTIQSIEEGLLKYDEVHQGLIDDREDWINRSISLSMEDNFEELKEGLLGELDRSLYALDELPEELSIDI